MAWGRGTQKSKITFDQVYSKAFMEDTASVVIFGR